MLSSNSQLSERVEPVQLYIQNYYSFQNAFLQEFSIKCFGICDIVLKMSSSGPTIISYIFKTIIHFKMLCLRNSVENVLDHDIVLKMSYSSCERVKNLLFRLKHFLYLLFWCLKCEIFSLMYNNFSPSRVSPFYSLSLSLSLSPKEHK